MSTENPKRMIVGISGATGVIFGVPILQMLYDLRLEPHLVVTKPGEMTGAAGTDLASSELKALADHSYPINGVGAAIASGSFHNMGMIVAPCSI